MYKILIVEDDDSIAKSMKSYLETWSYDVKLIDDFNSVAEEFIEYDPDLVLMDIRLPFYNGYYWCEQIRKTSNKPIIFISSANDNMNIMMAISKGADDFVSKPFDLNILLAKIQAVLRRTYEFNLNQNVYEYKSVTFNIGKSQVFFDDEMVELSKNEAKILKVLMELKEQIVSRDHLMEYLWDTDEFIDDNTLTVNINRLRRKIEQLGVKDLIHTKKGQGYKIYKEND